jgi:hypothetical protein
MVSNLGNHCPELFWVNGMFKSLDSIDRDNGNVIKILIQQIAVALNVDDFQRVIGLAAGLIDRLLGFVTQMAAGARIDNHMWFQVEGTPFELFDNVSPVKPLARKSRN